MFSFSSRIPFKCLKIKTFEISNTQNIYNYTKDPHQEHSLLHSHLKMEIFIFFVKSQALPHEFSQFAQICVTIRKQKTGLNQSLYEHCKSDRSKIGLFSTYLFCFTLFCFSIWLLFSLSFLFIKAVRWKLSNKQII